MPGILFTGGGSAGHVTPNIALMEAARDRGWQVEYVGSSAGIENEMISGLGVPFHVVSSGKLRRYFSWQNFLDPFRILLGICQAFLLLGRVKADLVFSKGGFVAVPVVVGAWLRGIPVISHESDVTPGLANQLTYPFVRKICVTFDASCSHLPAAKVVVTGTPVRRSILEGEAARGFEFLGMDSGKPLLLVFGGSLGAEIINRTIRQALDRLLDAFNVVHITGAGQVDASVDLPGYVQKEFLGDEFGDVLAAATLVVSRAGANSLYELFVTGKPHLLVPLSRAASRGDQIVNAITFRDEGLSRLVFEEELEAGTLVAATESLYEEREKVRQALDGFVSRDAAGLILAEIEKHLA